MQTQATHLCLMRLRFAEAFYDTFTDLLLAYTEKSLDFVALPINRHHSQLQTMNEQVSGYQVGFEIQLKLSLAEVEALDQFLLAAVSRNSYELLVSPLMELSWRDA